MALRSKNFLFKRISKDGEELEYQDSDSWYATNNDYHWNENSLALEAGGYYGSTTGLHTLAFTLRNFIGRIYVEATLSSTPTETDWFPIKFQENCKFYLEFTDTVIYNPDSEKTIYQHGVTGTFAENVVGNFTYLRVGIDRSYISIEPSELQKQLAGKLEEIQINY